jgi:hypothetical protein
MAMVGPPPKASRIKAAGARTRWKPLRLHFQSAALIRLLHLPGFAQQNHFSPFRCAGLRSILQSIIRQLFGGLQTAIYFVGALSFFFSGIALPTPR